MKIMINSIKAAIVDSSTLEDNNYVIAHWIVQYEISDSDHFIQGTLKWTEVPNIYKILKFINWFYGKRNTTTPQPS